MYELVISNNNVLCGIYYEGNFNAKDINNNKLSVQIVENEDLIKMIEFFNKDDVNIHNINNVNNDLEFYAGKLKVTLKDKENFINNKMFDFVLKKNKKYKLHKPTFIPKKAIALSLAISVFAASCGAYSAALKKNVDKINNISTSYSATYVDSKNNDITMNDSIRKKENNTTNINVTENNYKEEIKEKEVIDKESDASSIINKLNIESETKSEKFLKTKDLYFDIIEKYSNTYNLDPNLMLAIATQESGVHRSIIDDGGAIGLMQIQVNVWNNHNITAYNYDLDCNETECVSLEDLKDVSYNIKIGCMIYQSYLNQLCNNKYAALQAYNMGIGSMNKILDNYSKKSGKSKEDILKENDLGWIDFINIDYKGDPIYYKNVLRYYDENNNNINKIR